jgi:4-carboxymuconolactone decarboxylase
MKTILLAAAACLVAVSARAQAQSQPLPPDINPVTLSRLPPITPADLDEEGQNLLAARQNVTPAPGPGHIGVYNPKASEGTGALGRALGVPTGEKSRLGARMYQLVVLITAREIDQQYEWSAHEPAGLRVGLEQSVIDVVKYDRDVKGLAEKDATVIQFLRTLMREHKVSSDLWAKQIQLFGRQNTVEIMQLMGDYFMAGTMMNAADQHLPPTRQALLPALAKKK